MSENIAIKLCRDCKHAHPTKYSSEPVMCNHPIVVLRDAGALVSPIAEYDGVLAVYQRSNTSWFAACGQRGKLWGPKP